MVSDAKRPESLGEHASAPVVSRPAAAPSAAPPIPDAEPVDAPTDAPEPVVVTNAGGAMRTTPVGSLRGPQFLRRLYESLAHLEDGSAKDDLRILQYGDSHTASDLPTATVRRLLQQRFGDGGRGFVAIGKPWKKYTQDAIHTGMSKEFMPEKGRRGLGDGAYGLLGIAIESSEKSAKAWLDVTASSSRLELAYLEQPRGGSFDVFIDGAKPVRVASKAAKAQSAWRAFDVAEGPHKIEVRAADDGDVRLFGVALDRAAPGVVVDALGINGAQIHTALAWNEAHFAEQLKHRAPDVVVLAYGTNESLEKLAAADYERKLVDLLGRVARAVPTAACLLIGPPDRAALTKGTKDDWKTAPKLVEIVESQRRVAEAAGCAFYDQLEAMGGPGSIAVWSKEPHPRGGKDRIHLTRDGYSALATAFVGDLLRAYAVWRTDNGLPPSSK
jgi:lysophospholipase L1-like esterase